MSVARRWLFALLPLAVAFLSSNLPAATAQEVFRDFQPVHLGGLAVPVRTGGEINYSPRSPRFYVEFFHEPKLGAFLALSETGHLSIVRSEGSNAAPSPERPEWKRGYELRCRAAKELEFTKETKKWGVEAYHIPRFQRVLFVTETGAIALATTSQDPVASGKPDWNHGMSLKVRKQDEADFTGAIEFGLEIFREKASNRLLYISETGAISATNTSLAKPDPQNTLGPRSHYGLNLTAFTSDTSATPKMSRQVAVEILEDPNSKQLLYLTDGGMIAAISFGGKLASPEPATNFKGKVTLRVRRSGQSDLASAKAFGFAVYEERRANCLIFLGETGSIGVLPR